MKILFITHKYPPIIGGMEKQSFELITRAKTQNDVVICAYKGEGSKLKWFINLKKEVKRILKENPDIELIHLNDGLMAAATLWLKKFTDTPVVVTLHGLDITFPSKIFQNRVVKKMHNLDGFICVSHATTNACLIRGFEKEKVFTVLNGVDHNLAEIKREPNFIERVKNENGVDLSDKKIVMTMGRPVKRKGFSWFLKNVVPGLNKDIVFVMVGPLNTKPGIGERIINTLPFGLNSKLQLMFGIATDVAAITEALSHPLTQDRVYHMGKVSFSDLMQYLSVADVFVMPNIKVKGDAEGFGLVALEASLRGTPVIASGIEGITDAVRDGENGIQLISGDSELWIKTINSIIEDEEKLKFMSKSAIDTTLKNFGWDKMVSEYLDVFKKVISMQSN